MKKVLLSVNNNKLSGIENHVLLLAKNLSKKEFDVTVAVPMDGEFVKTLNESNVKYFIFDNEKVGTTTLKGAINLFNHIRKNKYDIIHAHAGIIPAVWGRLFRTPRIIEHKHGMDYSDEELKQLSKLKIRYENIKQYVPHYTIVECEHDKKYIMNNFGYSEKKIVKLNNAIPDIDIPRKQNNSSIIRIGTIGRLTYQKSQEWFIQIASNLLKDNKNLEFFIYGSGENFDLYNKMINELGISKYVKLKGYTTNTIKSLSEFDIFLLTSRYEGMPFIILETMKLSLPIVTFNVGAIPEMIENNKSGIIIDKYDLNKMETELRFLIDNPERRISLGKNARKRFEENFTIDRMIKRTEDLYNGVI